MINWVTFGSVLSKLAEAASDPAKRVGPMMKRPIGSALDCTGATVPLLAAVAKPSLTVLPETVPSLITGVELELLPSSLEPEELLLEPSEFFEESVLLELSELEELSDIPLPEAVAAFEPSEPADLETEESSAMATWDATTAAAANAVRR